MRIRRRPQPAASDLAASTAPQIPPPNAARNRGWLLAGEGEGEDEDREARMLRASADLAHESGASRRMALPQVCLCVFPRTGFMEEMVTS